MRIVIVGAGGLGREVLEILKSHKSMDLLSSIVDKFGFADDNLELKNKVINGVSVLDSPVVKMKLCSHIIAIGNNSKRKEMASRLDPTLSINAIHPLAIISKGIKIGTDVIIQAGTVLTDSSIRIGNHTHIDADCTLSHDVILQDYVRLNPGVTVCGNVTIEEGAYIGAGSTIKEGVRIGAWSTVGMGSVVLNDVPANTTVFGVPAK